MGSLTIRHTIHNYYIQKVPRRTLKKIYNNYSYCTNPVVVMHLNNFHQPRRKGLNRIGERKKLRSINVHLTISVFVKILAFKSFIHTLLIYFRNVIGFFLLNFFFNETRK